MTINICIALFFEITQRAVDDNRTHETWCWTRLKQATPLCEDGWMIWQYSYYILVFDCHYNYETFLQDFFINSEASASEFIENLEEKFCIKFKSYISHTIVCYPSRKG